MNISSISNTLTHLTQMGDVTLYEPAGDKPQAERRTEVSTGKQGRYQSRSLSECISNVSTPTGKKALLKTMITTACERNCYYCPFRAGRGKTKRVTFTPDAMAGAFDTMQRAGQVDGLFLSSGIIKGSITTQDKIIDTVEIVRQRYNYRGYIHLKIMPGVEYDQLYRAMQLADRISVNLEAPTQERLTSLAPKKDLNRELIQMLSWAEKLRREHPYEKLANTVTQFVVGAVGDTDLELLSTSEHLYRQMGLTRAYYSGFGPVIDTPLENVAGVDPLREHRLYQASFLLRDYQWSTEEMSFMQDGNLRLDVDPKKAWADEYLTHTPIELMNAPREQLLRVPGIGPKGADAILKARHKGVLTDLSHLRKLGIRAPEQTAPYVLLNGHKPNQQLKLF
jgi:predicted DNA-binding helix-hairpin-helix protein